MGKNKWRIKDPLWWPATHMSHPLSQQSCLRDNFSLLRAKCSQPGPGSSSKTHPHAPEASPQAPTRLTLAACSTNRLYLQHRWVGQWTSRSGRGPHRKCWRRGGTTCYNQRRVSSGDAPPHGLGFPHDRRLWGRHGARWHETRAAPSAGIAGAFSQGDPQAKTQWWASRDTWEGDATLLICFPATPGIAMYLSLYSPTVANSQSRVSIAEQDWSAESGGISKTIWKTLHGPFSPESGLIFMATLQQVSSTGVWEQERVMLEGQDKKEKAASCWEIGILDQIYT